MDQSVVKILSFDQSQQQNLFYKLNMKTLGLTLALIIAILTQNQSSQTQIQPQQTHSIQRDSSRQLVSSNVQGSESQINEEYLETVQNEALQEQVDGNLNEWVSVQLQEAGKIKDFSFGESFIIHLQPKQSFEYKWNLANPQSQKRDYLLFLSIFTHQRGEEVSPLRNPDEDSYVQVETKSKLHQSYSKIGKLYVSKVFSITFSQESKFIRFTNRNGIPVLVDINMEVDFKQISKMAGIATNKHFALPAQKLSTIYQELKNTEKSRTRMYKYEWGFLEKEERYDEEMLKLTGVQLVVILTTAIVQMYCIKSMFQNRQII